jgi:hypothetical protein
MIKSRRMRWVEYVVHMCWMTNAYKLLIGKPERKRPLDRSRCRHKDNIKMDLTKIRLDDVDWIHQAQDRDWWCALVNTVVNLHMS